MNRRQLARGIAKNLFQHGHWMPKVSSSEFPWCEDAMTDRIAKLLPDPSRDTARLTWMLKTLKPLHCYLLAMPCNTRREIDAAMKRSKK